MTDYNADQSDNHSDDSFTEVQSHEVASLTTKDMHDKVSFSIEEGRWKRVIGDWNDDANQLSSSVSPHKLDNNHVQHQHNSNDIPQNVAIENFHKKPTSSGQHSISSREDNNIYVPYQHKVTTIMTMVPFESFKTWATLIDVLPDGNCFFYVAIIALHCHRRDNFYLEHDSIDARMEHLQSILRDVTSFRKHLFNVFADNQIKFISTDPAIRKVHNADGEVLTAFRASYANNLIGKDSIGQQLYRDGVDYNNGCRSHMWGDIFNHVPIIAFAHAITVITYYQMSSNRNGIDGTNCTRCTLVAEYIHTDGSIKLHDLCGSWYMPNHTVQPYIAMMYDNNHFQLVLPNSCPVKVPFYIGTSFTENLFHHDVHAEDHNDWLEEKEVLTIDWSVQKNLLSHQHRIRPLSTEDADTVQEALYSSGHKWDVIANDESNYVKRENFWTLRPGKWLNDEVINYYIKNCLRKRDEMLCSKDTERKRSHFFNSFFAQTMFDLKNDDDDLKGKYNYNNVRAWSNKVPGGNIFKLKYVFCPINIDNIHWVGVCMFMEQKTIEYFDSLSGSGSRYLNGFLKYVDDEWHDKTGERMDMNEWKIVDCQSSTPRQSNGFDCGVFTCMFAHFLTKDCRPTFQQRDISECRNYIALSILKNRVVEPFENEPEDESQSPSDLSTSSSKPSQHGIAHEHGFCCDEFDNLESPPTSFHSTLSIVKPSNLNLEEISRNVGGKPHISVYKHFHKEVTINGLRYFMYKELQDETFSVTVPSLALCGQIVVSHDGSKLTSATLGPNFKGGAWFRDEIVKAKNFPPHISLRCQNSKATSFNRGRGKRCKHPYLIYFTGWCTGRKDRKGDGDGTTCTTSYVGGLDYDNLLLLAMKPNDSMIKLEIRLNGRCVHCATEMLGQLRGPSRKRALDNVQNDRKRPKEHAIENLASMKRQKYLTNNHNGEASSPRKIYNLNREVSNMRREEKGILLDIKEDMNNIFRVQARTSEHDEGERRSAGDKSTSLLGVCRLVQIIPEVNIWLHSRRMLNLAGQLSVTGRLVMCIDGTGGLLNFTRSQHDGKIQHVFLSIQLSECMLDKDTGKNYGKNVSNVITVAERIGSRNTASDFEEWLTTVRNDTTTAMSSYGRPGYGHPLRPTVVKMDCALELLSGCLRAFRSEQHVQTASGYNAIVYHVLLWHESQLASEPVANHEQIARSSLKKILIGSPCILKQCKVHVQRAIKSWPCTLKKKPMEICMWKKQFEHLFSWLSEHVTTTTSLTEVMVRLCVVITILSTERIPCGRFDRKSVTESSHVPWQSNDIAQRMHEIIKEEVRRIRINSEENLDKLLQQAYDKHRSYQPFDASVVVQKVLDRMLGREDDVKPMSFSVTYLSEVNGKKGTLKVVHILSPYAQDQDGEEFVSPKMLGGTTVDICLPHRRDSVLNPLFSPTAATYIRNTWLNRIGLWSEGVIELSNMAVDANVYSNNQCSEGFINGLKNHVSTVNDDVKSIADLIHRRYHDSVGMGRLISNQIDQSDHVIQRRRYRKNSVTRNVNTIDAYEESNMEWKRNPGTTRSMLAHYRQVMMRGLEGGREKGSFQFDINRHRSMWLILNDHATNLDVNFMSITTFSEWLCNKRSIPLKQEWSDVIDHFYNTYGC